MLFSLTLSHFLTLAECPTIQLISDTIYQEMVSDSKGLPTRLPSTSDANFRPRLLPVVLTN